MQCYSCTLLSLTRGLAPEEGDFNTASIQSGTITPQERQWLQEDLESVEVVDPYEDLYEDPYDYDDDHEYIGEYHVNDPEAPWNLMEGE